MAAFAEAADLAELLRVDFDGADVARATLLLDLASAEIRGAAGGQEILAASTTETLDGSGTRILLLSQVPVTAVTSVTEDGEALVEGDDEDYEWSAHGVLQRVGACWPSKRRSVVVAYAHGYATAPEELRLICLAAAARAWTNPAGDVQETLGDHSATHARPAGVWLTEGEREQVAAGYGAGRKAASRR